jgi:hypothetical protein
MFILGRTRATWPSCSSTTVMVFVQILLQQVFKEMKWRIM